MATPAFKRDADQTIALTLLLLTEPRLNAEQVASSLGISQNALARTISRICAAGQIIDYDFGRERYSARLSDDYAQSLVRGYFRHVAKTLRKSASNKVEAVFLSSVHRYNIVGFAQILGCSPANVYNMCVQHKNQRLPQ